LFFSLFSLTKNVLDRHGYECLKMENIPVYIFFCMNSLTEIVLYCTLFLSFYSGVLSSILWCIISRKLKELYFYGISLPKEACLFTAVSFLSFAQFRRLGCEEKMFMMCACMFTIRVCEVLRICMKLRTKYY